MRKLAYLIYIFCLGGIMSCEQSINLELNAYEPKPVVYSLFREGDTPQVAVLKSESFYGWIENVVEREFIEGLEVTIDHGSDKEMLTGSYKQEYNDPGLWGFIDSIDVYTYESNIPVDKSLEYQLSFEYEGKSVSANTFIPSKTEINSIVQDKIEVLGFDYSYVSDAVRISFRDQANEANAYRAKMVYRHWVYDWDRDPMTGMLVIKDSALKENTLQSQLILDDQLRGQETSLVIPIPQVYTYSPLHEPSKELDLKCVIETYTYEAGKYFISMREQQQVDSDPFSEPVFLKDNIKNGIGIFSGYSVSDTVEFKFVFED